MRLFFTGAKTFLAEQANPNLSLGGFVSSSPVPFDQLDGVFGGVSDYEAANGNREVRCFVLKNESGGLVSGATVWYESAAVNAIFSYRMAIVAVGTNDCSEFFTEKIANGQTLPLNATFTDNRDQANALTFPDVADGAYVALWVERVTNSYAFQESMSCDNLYTLFQADPLPQIQTVQTVADVTDSLNDTYWVLNTIDRSFYLWYDTGAGTDPAIAGKEGIRVVIATDDDAPTVASKTQAQIQAILTPRGEVTATVDPDNLDTIIVTNIQDGPCLDSSAGTSGFTITVTQEGAANSQELVESTNFFIAY